MAKTGGYQIIDLKNNDLLSLSSLAGIYDAIEGNYRKAILLSGIVISGVEKSDIFTIPEVSGSSFVLRNVYGYDVTIADDDSISVASTQWATKTDITSALKLANIKDADGNSRFFDIDVVKVDTYVGNLNFSGIAGLSGKILTIAFSLGNKTGATISPNAGKICEIDAPQWLLDKIYTWVSGSTVVRFMNIEKDTTITVTRAFLRKDSSGLYVEAAGGDFPDNTVLFAEVNLVIE